MRDIGARLGPFDVTMIEVGQYHRAWPDWHIGPEQAVLAHGMVRGRVMLPMHWGLFHARAARLDRADRARAGGRRFRRRGDRDAAARRQRRTRGAARGGCLVAGGPVGHGGARPDPIDEGELTVNFFGYHPGP